MRREPTVREIGPFEFAVSIPLRNAGAHRHGSLVDHVNQSKIVQAIDLYLSIGLAVNRGTACTRAKAWTIMDEGKPVPYHPAACILFRVMHNGRASSDPDRPPTAIPPASKHTSLPPQCSHWLYCMEEGYGFQNIAVP